MDDDDVMWISDGKKASLSNNDMEIVILDETDSDVDIKKESSSIGIDNSANSGSSTDQICSIKKVSNKVTK